MAFSNIDRTAEVDAFNQSVLIKSTDYCNYYERHPDTFLQRKECWTCIYSDFGIDTGAPTDTGRCIYKKMKTENDMVNSIQCGEGLQYNVIGYAMTE